MWIKVSGLKSGGRKSPTNVLTQIWRKRATTFLQCPLQASGWKKQRVDRGRCSEQHQGRGQTALWRQWVWNPCAVSSCAWRAALAWHTQGGVTPCPKLGSAEVSSCGCRGGSSCGSGDTWAAQRSNCAFPWPGEKLQSALLNGNSFC